MKLTLMLTCVCMALSFSLNNPWFKPFPCPYSQRYKALTLPSRRQESKDFLHYLRTTARIKYIELEFHAVARNIVLEITSPQQTRCVKEGELTRLEKAMAPSIDNLSDHTRQQSTTPPATLATQTPTTKLRDEEIKAKIVELGKWIEEELKKMESVDQRCLISFPPISTCPIILYTLLTGTVFAVLCSCVYWCLKSTL